MFKFILILLLAIILVVIVRTLLFFPKKQEQYDYNAVRFEGEAAIKALAELVKCKTVSNYDPKLEDDKEFEKLYDKLPKLYPNVFKKCKLKKFKSRALLFHWKGQEKGEPAVFMAHYDVVPVEEENWSVPPFKAIIKDGAMWGRGTLDTKVTFNGILSAAENLIKQEFTPKHDIYFAFSGGEEVSGPGAKDIVDYFKKQGITPAFVIDEGGAVVEDIFPGVHGKCGLVGLAEKGLCNIELSVKSDGGHASAPKAHTPVGILADACCKVENNPFEMHIDGPAALMFDELGRRSTFVYRMIFANMWLFGKIFDNICKKSGGEINALVRTTVAFTKMRGSKAPNVVPPIATMAANIRINPKETVDDVVNHFKKVINNPDVEIKVLEGDNPSCVSTTECEGYKIIKEAIVETWDNCVVAPYLMVQCSDSRHYSEISDRVYRFSAFDITAEERKTIHGNDEHIRLEVIKRAVEFFYRCIEKC